MTALDERREGGPLLSIWIEKFNFIMCFSLCGAFSADNQEVFLEVNRRVTSTRSWEVADGRKGEPLAYREVVIINLWDSIAEDPCTAICCRASPCRIPDDVINEDGIVVIARSWGIWKDAPCVGSDIVFVEPGYVTINVAVSDAANKVELLIADDDPCTTTRARNSWAFAPSIGDRIVNEDGVDWSLVRKASFKGSCDPELAIDVDSLEVMDVDRRRSSGRPSFCNRIVNR